uniref:Uncharacterized protein n=1 Tax=Meloidogyne incognita TaxID=6306 RepID=A0A914LDA8_MELIC
MSETNKGLLVNRKDCYHYRSHFIRKRGVEKYKKNAEPKQDGKSDTNVTSGKQSN